jgi:UTP--glucose-1-phosphate uridylyltransferase
MEQARVPFAMEVVQRTSADRKGGHLARRRSDRQLLLRETAQTSDEDRAAMHDLDRHRWANTNNLWIDLRALDTVMRERDGVLGLPLIRNEKTVDPTDPQSTPVYQLESAMGAAIATFDGSQAIEVDRSRFAPVKTTDDLLVLRSDAYEVDDQARVQLVAERAGHVPMVSLDPTFYRMLPEFDARFADGPPSLRECDRFTVEGDVRFGADVVVRGEVVVRAPSRVEQLVVPARAVLD